MPTSRRLRRHEAESTGGRLAKRKTSKRSDAAAHLPETVHGTTRQVRGRPPIRISNRPHDPKRPGAQGAQPCERNENCHQQGSSKERPPRAPAALSAAGHLTSNKLGTDAGASHCSDAEGPAPCRSWQGPARPASLAGGQCAEAPWWPRRGLTSRGSVTATACRRSRRDAAGGGTLCQAAKGPAAAGTSWAAARVPARRDLPRRGGPQRQLAARGRCPGSEGAGREDRVPGRGEPAPSGAPSKPPRRRRRRQPGPRRGPLANGGLRVGCHDLKAAAPGTVLLPIAGAAGLHWGLAGGVLACRLPGCSQLLGAADHGLPPDHVGRSRAVAAQRRPVPARRRWMHGLRDLAQCLQRHPERLRRGLCGAVCCGIGCPGAQEGHCFGGAAPFPVHAAGGRGAPAGARPLAGTAHSATHKAVCWYSGRAPG